MWDTIRRWVAVVSSMLHLMGGGDGAPPDADVDVVRASLGGSGRNTTLTTAVDLAMARWRLHTD